MIAAIVTKKFENITKAIELNTCQREITKKDKIARMPSTQSRIEQCAYEIRFRVHKQIGSLVSFYRLHEK